MDTNDWMKVILAQTALIAVLNQELYNEQQRSAKVQEALTKAMQKLQIRTNDEDETKPPDCNGG